MDQMANTKDVRWHLGHLDALRGIAVLGVLMVHSGLFIGMGPRSWMIVQTGQRGVQLFFIVSAFTLFMSYDNRREEHNPTLNFFLRRIFRIMPMFYVATAVACLAIPDLIGPRNGVILSLLFLNGFVPRAIMHGAAGGWSVATEAIFYMCLPLLFRAIRNLTAAVWLLCVSAPLMYLAGSIAARHYPEHADYFTFFGFAVEVPVFAAGIVIYFLWKEHVHPNRAASRTASKQQSLLLLGLAGVLYRLNLPFSYRYLYFSSLVCAILVLSLCVYPWGLFVNRCTIFIGKISFSLYLLHAYVLLPVLHLVEREAQHHGILAHKTLQAAVIFALTFLVTVPLSALSWMFIETPGIRLGRRLIAHLEGRGLSRREAKSVPPPMALTGTGNSPDAQF